MDDKSIKNKDSGGRFLPGHKLGHRFKKGETGSKKGMKWKRTQAAAAFAREILGTDPETGEKLTTPEVIKRLSKHAEKHPQFMIELLRHDLGKSLERVQVEPTAIIIHTLDQDEIQGGQELDGFTLKESNAESEEQAALPEGE